MSDVLMLNKKRSTSDSLNSGKPFWLSFSISEAPIGFLLLHQLCIAASHFLISALLEPFAWLISD